MRMNPRIRPFIFANEGLKLARRLHHRVGEARMLNDLARVNGRYDNLQSAVQYQSEALHLFHTLYDYADSTDAMTKLGVLAGRLNRLGRANSCSSLP